MPDRPHVRTFAAALASGLVALSCGGQPDASPPSTTTTAAAPASSAPVTTTTVPSVEVTSRTIDEMLAAFAAAVGTDGFEVIESTNFGIYPGYAILEARDPQAPNHIDRYDFRGGRVTGPEPVRFSPSQIPGRAFRLGAITWEAIPARIREAPGLVDVDDGYVSYVSAYFNGTEVLVTIRVDSVRYGATVVVDRRGRVLRTSVD